MRASLTVAVLACLAVLPSRNAHAFGDRSAFTFAILRHSGNYDPRPSGLRRISWELAKRTSLDVKLDPKIIDPTDPDLFRYPVLVLTGDGDFTPFSEADREAIRRHLTFGGFLLVDDASGQPGGPFDQAARREISAILPNSPIVTVPKTHVLYRSFYLLDGPAGRVATRDVTDAVVLQGRLAVVFSPDDLQGATARDGIGDYQYEVVPGGEEQREKAFRFGINVVMYALCLDYKDDQVHVDFLKRRRH